MDYLCKAVSDELKAMPAKKRRIISVTIHNIEKTNEDIEKKEQLMKLLFLPPTLCLIEEKEKEKKKEKIPRLVNVKRDRMDTATPGARSMTALLARLYAMQCLFGDYMPVMKPLSFTDEMWQQVQVPNKVKLESDFFRLMEDKKSYEVKVAIHNIYDTLIHYRTNYDINRETYPFNRKSRFRWWSSMDVPTFAPIKNFNESSSLVTIRFFTFPAKLMEHPKLAQGGPGWFPIMASYMKFLLEALVPDKDKMAILENGGTGRRRTQLIPNMSPGDLEQRLEYLTDDFLYTLNQ